MQHSLNEVIQLLTSNTVPVCVCAGCPLALRYLQTLAQSGLPQPSAQYSHEFNCQKVSNPCCIQAVAHADPSYSKYQTETNQKPREQGSHRAGRLFFSLAFSVWGVHVENFFSWLHLRILNAYRRDQKSFQPSTKTTFTHSHRKRADFWQKGQNPLYILIFYATFISPHHTMQPNIVFCSQRKT